MKDRKTGVLAKASISLEEWINELGVVQVAKLMKVEPSAVRHWRRGHCLPKSEQMFRIHKYSKGRVSYFEMIETYCNGPQKLAFKRPKKLRTAG